jgi:hypothetical protein
MYSMSAVNFFDRWGDEEGNVSACDVIHFVAGWHVWLDMRVV